MNAEMQEYFKSTKRDCERKLMLLIPSTIVTSFLIGAGAASLKKSCKDDSNLLVGLGIAAAIPVEALALQEINNNISKIRGIKLLMKTLESTDEDKT